LYDDILTYKKGGYMVRKTVLIDDDIVQQINLLAKKEDRDFSSSIRYAIRIGLIALQNPELTAEEIKDILEAKAELEAGIVEELSLEGL
jgi:predicted transcriptional regulator